MKRVLVLGLGRFGGGAAAARFFAERGHDVLVTDSKSEDRLAASLCAQQRCTLGRQAHAGLGALDAQSVDERPVHVDVARVVDHDLLAGRKGDGAPFP